MSYKSRPGGWDMPVCIGYCRHKKDGQACIKCFNKSKYQDCRETCKFYGLKCKECEDSALYRQDNN